MGTLTQRLWPPFAPDPLADANGQQQFCQWGNMRQACTTLAQAPGAIERMRVYAEDEW